MELGDIPGFFRSKMDGQITIKASSEALEAFREILASNGNPWCRLEHLQLVGIKFETEPIPFRSNESNLVDPYLDHSVEWDESAGEFGGYTLVGSKVNPEYLLAPFEFVVGYGVGGMQIVTYNRRLNLI